MKIVHVIDGLGTGGAERSLAELLPRLDRRGIVSIVACLHRRAEGVQDVVLADGHDVRFVTSQGLPGRVRELRQLVRRERPDLVHTTLFDADLAGRLAAVGTGAPVVSSLVNTPYDVARRSDPNVPTWRLRVVHALDRWTARHLTVGFVPITEAVAAAAEHDLGIPRGRVVVVERGRDRDRLGEPGAQRRHEVRSRLGIADDAEVLLQIGRQEHQKGVDVFVRIVGRLADRPRLVGLHAGRRGAASNAIDAAVDALGVAERVRFLGHRDDVGDLLAAADVFVFPSRYEGLGGSLLEAMALGVPIVASDVPAIREIVERGPAGILVPTDDVEAFAAAVQSVLDDASVRAALGRRGREVFESTFTAEAIADRFAAALRGFAARGR